jgi:hypothetical protein
MRLPSSLYKILENKNKPTFYILILLAGFYNLNFLLMRKYVNIIIFSVMLFACSFFSKIKSLNLITTLVLTWLTIFIGSKMMFMEGLDNMDASANTKKDNKDKDSKGNDNNNKDKVNKGKENKDLIGIDESVKADDATAAADTDDVVGYDSKDETMTTMYKNNNRIDYASTLEEAYGDLNKILGGNGVKQLTDDTQRLMKQQMALADAMKSMGPLMEQAKGLMQGFDLKNLDGLASMAKKFTTSATTPTP